MTDSENAVLTESGVGESPVMRRSRKWPADQRRRIAKETFAPGASVSVVARQHDVNANLVFEWRRQYRQGNLVKRKPLANGVLVSPDLVRIGVIGVDGGICPLPALPELRPSGIIEIKLCGAKMRVNSDIDEASLQRVAGFKYDAFDRPVVALRPKPGGQCVNVRCRHTLPHGFTLTINHAHMCRLQ